uniref:Uncharacterized protein n=1 Tax=Lepeophtheirus salmonis TaxID=72036 RepID=A0A0K2UM88_LEPSM
MKKRVIQRICLGVVVYVNKGIIYCYGKVCLVRQCLITLVNSILFSSLYNTRILHRKNNVSGKLKTRKYPSV